MYYEKSSLVYGSSSGRAIEPDYPSSSLDIEPKIDRRFNCWFNWRIYRYFQHQGRRRNYSTTVLLLPPQLRFLDWMLTLHSVSLVLLLLDTTDSMLLKN